MGLIAWMLIRTILLSIIGSTVDNWFARTKIGIWFDKKVSNLLTHITGKVQNLELANAEVAQKSAQIDMFDDDRINKP
jgi:hypothetical protein|tara:strand:- start:74 stop:307 length:234 start_codon:yes stop_codon:yes gene_type:complete